MSLAELPNLGPKSSEMLATAGIVSKKQLQDVGAVAAYLAVCETDANVSLNLLWSIAGALENKHWTAISPATKQQLVDELKMLVDNKKTG